MKNAGGAVIYVGKAAVLRNRLRSYFGSPAGLDRKTRRMVSELADFEYIVTDTEAEALILENTLIKRHRPYFNVRLKDDKTYPYLKVDLAEDFPRVYITRGVHKDGARYFGPFASAGSVRKSMDLVKKLFPYRSCTKKITGTDPRPCLEYYIHRCVGPCAGLASQDEYAEVVKQVILFLEGNTEMVTGQLRDKMEAAAEDLEFERAAVLRDQMGAIQKFEEERTVKVDSGRLTDLDAIAVSNAANETWVEVFFIRRGKLIGRDHFFMEGPQDDEPGEIIAQFVQQFYATALEDFLRSRRGGAVRLYRPQRGENRQLMEVVVTNAIEGLAQHRVKWLNRSDAIQGALTELEEELSLPTAPRRMECYDVSHIQGSNLVGSMVVFDDGKPRTRDYRRFKIKAVEGVDDYASMKEMLTRRFKRLSQAIANPDPDGKVDTWGVLPDLVIIDGGKGHLSAAQEVMLHLGLEQIPLCSLAKENEEIFVPHTPESIVLPRDSQALYLMQRIRDEAHRFAISFHRNLRSKSSLKSPIDMVTGIGPKRKRMLLRRFGSLQGIKEATVEDIAAVPGLTRSLAVRLKQTI
ncbi:UvrABC system protein C [Geodia barretti]|uniref:UvrABC system protein C n=1 Tax=Geodia barretti TaxID=519541 RepID=A0AA35XH29_GEOBA|nr:UvrABC system protein C [Geodia barretti]